MVRKTLLFVNKKKQKNFHLLAPGIATAQANESFLVLFFKKERACLLQMSADGVMPNSARKGAAWSMRPVIALASRVTIW